MWRRLMQFLFVFFPMVLFVGLGATLDIHRKVSDNERRNLAELPKLFWLKGVETERFISDHIPFRDKLFDIYFRLNFVADLDAANIMKGKEGWLFRPYAEKDINLNILDVYQNRVVLKEEELLRVRENMQSVLDWCNLHNIRVYVMIPPSKTRVYHRYMPDYILRTNAPSIEMQIESVMPVLDHLNEGVRFIPLTDFLDKQSYTSQYLLYYKTESHWSEEGAYLAYHKLIEKIGMDFPDVVPVTKENFNISMSNLVYSPYYHYYPSPFTKGNLFLFGMTEYEDVFYPHYEYKDIHNIHRINDEVLRYSVYPSKKYNVYVIGDSYATWLYEFLMPTFHQVMFFRFNNLTQKHGFFFKNRKSEILSNQTDILIFAVSDLKVLYFYTDF